MVAHPLRMCLTPEEDQTLLDLRTAAHVPQRTKDRARALRLNHRGLPNQYIAEYLGWQVASVRTAIHRWEQHGLYGLWDAPRQGAPRRWQMEDVEYIEQVIEQEERTVSPQQLAQQLEQQRHITLSRRHLRRLLRKRGTAGSEPAIAISSGKTPWNEPPNKPN